MFLFAFRLTFQFGGICLGRGPLRFLTVRGREIGIITLAGPNPAHRTANGEWDAPRSGVTETKANMVFLGQEHGSQSH